MAQNFKKPYEKQPRNGFKTTGASMTHQSFKKECDINNIMKKYQKTGLADHVSTFQGDYTDLTDVPTYHEAMNKVISANSAFSTLPSSVRKRFNNDPAEFLNFVSDENNREEMEQLGLIPPSLPDPDPLPADTPPPEPVQ